MKSVSAVLISYNEEDKIERALLSLGEVVDEIVVVDSESQDRTREICRRFTDRVLVRAWGGYRDQKQFATDQASHDWVLSLDCDEALSPDLRIEIQEWRSSSSPPEASGFLIPRLTCFMGRWIRHGGWYPDWQLRLFRRDAGRWEGARVHEAFRSRGRLERFRAPILHWTYSSFSEYLQQLDRFSGLSAADYLERGGEAGFWRILATPPMAFTKSFLLKRGFLDGLPGLGVAALSATSALFKLLKLWELRNLGDEAPRPDSER